MTPDTIKITNNILSDLPAPVASDFADFDWAFLLSRILHDFRLLQEDEDDIYVLVANIISFKLVPEQLPFGISAFTDLPISDVKKMSDRITSEVLQPLDEYLQENLELYGIEKGVFPSFVPQHRTLLLFRDADMINEPLTISERKLHHGIEFDDPKEKEPRTLLPANNSGKIKIGSENNTENEEDDDISADMIRSLE